MSAKKPTQPPSLDPDAPGLDEITRRRRTLARMEQMSGPELFDIAVDAGIYTRAGKLTSQYRAGGPPSATRPKD